MRSIIETLYITELIYTPDQATRHFFEERAAVYKKSINLEYFPLRQKFLEIAVRSQIERPYSVQSNQADL